MRLLHHLFFIGIILLLTGFITLTGIYLYFNKDLPDHHQLSNHRPPMTSRIYSNNGELLERYSFENRLYVPIGHIPPLVINAFITAEDRNFWDHPDIDISGIFRAIWHNFFTENRLHGASTITQQVAKNILLTPDRNLSRKIREAILAFRIDRTFPKEKVLELYLNEIYLGNGAYGIAAAALSYFNKPLDALTIEKAALLAALPKAPSKYNPYHNPERAKERRDYIIKNMMYDDLISDYESKISLEKPITLKKNIVTPIQYAGYFNEEVRQKIRDLYDDELLYKGGVSVHTTLNPTLQKIAHESLRKELIRYTRRHGYRGAYTHITTKNWHQSLLAVPRPDAIGDWSLAVILNINLEQKIVEIGLDDGNRSYITFAGLEWARHPHPASGKTSKQRPEDILGIGDVVLVEKLSQNISPYGLRQIPEVNGAVVILSPQDGKILALVGGYSFEESKFNRATQAKRQPGSALKPFIYLTALENSYSPSDLIADKPINLAKSVSKQEVSLINAWVPSNYSGLYYGPTTLRMGLEKSINVMTVHLGLLLGLEKISDVVTKYSIYDNPLTNIASVLGTQEVDLLSLTAAYGMLANGGNHIQPYAIDHITDRTGFLLYRHDKRLCYKCVPSSEMQNITLPSLSHSTQTLSKPEHVRQITSMLEGVFTRGTAKTATNLPPSIAGKTGTTNDSIDAWFLGFTPDLVIGVYVGYDIPKPLGKKETGATIALPIFNHIISHPNVQIPPRPFHTPENLVQVKVDLKTGQLPSKSTPSSEIIWEWFLPEQVPQESYERNTILPVINSDKTAGYREIDTPRPTDPFLQGTGGNIY